MLSSSLQEIESIGATLSIRRSYAHNTEIPNDGITNLVNTSSKSEKSNKSNGYY